MCNVVIPTSPVVSPNVQIWGEDLGEQLETQRFNYDDPFVQDLEGDYPSNGNGQFLSYTNQTGSNIPTTSNYEDVPAETGPVPENPGYEKLLAILNNVLGQDWREKGRPGNPNILQCYRVCGLGYDQDQSAMSYAWCAAFVSWALESSGIGGLKSMSSQAYKNYGAEVGWRNTSNIRRGDVAVFKSKTRSGGHVGFVWEVDKANKRFKILGGNQGDNAKISNYRFESKSQYTLTIRRNWAIPAELDTPIDGSTIQASAGAEDSTV